MKFYLRKSAFGLASVSAAARLGWCGSCISRFC
ncbi:YSIRK-type signal peptide-containing protein [Streptococcus equi]